MLYTNRLWYKDNHLNVWPEIFRQVKYFRQDANDPEALGTRPVQDTEFLDRALTFVRQQIAEKFYPVNAFDLTIPEQVSLQWDVKDEYGGMSGGCTTLTLLRRGEFRIQIQDRPLRNGKHAKGRAQGWKGLVDHPLLKAVRLPEQATCRTQSS